MEKKILTTRGGAEIEFIKRRDVLASTIGQIGVLPTHIILGTFRNMFRGTPREDLEKYFMEHFKDAPFQNGMCVRLGHSALFGELGRLFRDDIKGRPNIFWRIFAGIPSVFGVWLSGKFFRSDCYNPFTKTATVYHPNTSVGAHEIGHGLDYDHRKFPGLYALSNAIPPVTLYQEWKASNNAMRSLTSPEERKKASKVLEPAFGTYVGGIGGSLAGIPLAGKVFETVGTAISLGGSILGAIVGHITSRVRKKDKSWFFNPEKHKSFASGAAY